MMVPGAVMWLGLVLLGACGRAQGVPWRVVGLPAGVHPDQRPRPEPPDICRVQRGVSLWDRGASPLSGESEGMAKQGFLKRHRIVRNTIREDMLCFALPAVLNFSAGLVISASEGWEGLEMRT